MTAETLLHAGDPEAALQLLQEQVRKQPADAKLRIFLFQLLAITGQLKRAQAQLEIAGEMDSAAELMVRAYRDGEPPAVTTPRIWNNPLAIELPYVIFLRV